jgi:Lysozyme like domain
VSALPLIELAPVRGPLRPGLPRPAVQPLAAPPPEIDVDVQRVVLDVVNRKVRGLDTHIENSLTDGSIERTIDGASTLTLVVHDPKRALLQSGMFGHAIEVTLDRLKWRLVKVSKQDSDLTLTFEDRQVAYLRQHTKPKKATRGKLTRAEFALSLVREVKAGGGIKFVCPELHKAQPIAASSASVKGRALTKASGGSAADARSLRLVELWKQAGGDPKLAVTMAAIALAESGGVTDAESPPNKNGTVDRGLWQINSVHSQYDEARLLSDPLYNAKAAVAIERQQGLKAWTTYRSGAYRGHLSQAASAVARDESAGHADRRTLRKALPFQFRRGDSSGKPEDSWTCLQRLAEEVNWRCFMNEGSCWFISETQLMKAKPKLVLSESSPGVVAIDFDIDNGKVRSEVTVTCRASRWVAAPGSVVQLSGVGPANGKWLVSTLRRGLFDADAEITLKRATKKLAEPAAEVVTQSSSSTARAGGSSVAASAVAAGSGSMLGRAYAAMQAIHAKHYPYVWGGGHGAAGVPSGGGYDCSGSTVAVLAAAGMGFRPGGGSATSGTLMSWGVAGQGQHLTIWANKEHVFMVIDGHHFGTGNWGKGWGGAGFNPHMHPVGGFVARHWPGT